jgi:hypothetical protein
MKHKKEEITALMLDVLDNELAVAAAFSLGVS